MHRLPHRRNLWNEYVEFVGAKLNGDEFELVVDVGGGRACPFARHRQSTSRAKIVATDVSWDELTYNTDVDERVVADASRSLPFADGEVRTAWPFMYSLRSSRPTPC